MKYTKESASLKEQMPVKECMPAKAPMSAKECILAKEPIPAKERIPAETRSFCPGHSTDDANSRLIIYLRDLSHVMRFLYEGRGSQKRILIVLEEAGGRLTQRELTRRLGIQPGSASEVIAKLEHAGYIRRTPSKADRRTADIELTEAGKISALESRKQRIRRHEEMFACLSEDEKHQLLFLLEKVNTDWENRYQDAGAGRNSFQNGE